MKVLVNILSQSEGSISKLYLGKNCIKDEGVRVLSGHLSESTSVIAIDLSSNNLSQVGARDLFKALETN